MTSCSKLVLKSSNQMLEYNRFVKLGMKIDEGEIAADSGIYRKRSVEVLRWQFEMCLEKRKTQL